ncbi:MAG TPA: ABC transporter permease subunit, partial [Gammaproteobacteria bacterium]|nr:ABC transporter permease subunit [Gammaproteobacteria bacterium]
MATAWTVFLKETRDNLRDRRTLLSALLLGPTLGPVLFVALMQLAIQQQLKGEDELPLQVINAGLAPNLMQTLTAHGASITAIDAAADPKEIISADPDALVLRVPEDIQQRYREARTATLAIYYDRSRSAASNRADRLAGMLEAQGSQLASLRLQARGISPEVIAPLRVQRIDVSTPMARSVLVFGMLPYFLLLATIMGAFYVAIDSTAGERERGSLEPLLNLPISRGELV